MSNFVVGASLITESLTSAKSICYWWLTKHWHWSNRISQELSFNSNTFEINKEETNNDLSSQLYGQMKDQSMKTFFRSKRIIKGDAEYSTIFFKRTSAQINISYSVLNRIKRCPFSELNKQNSRKVTRISNWQRQVIINAIKEHFKQQSTL